MSGPDRPGGDREVSRTQPWEWRIDPPPPIGPDREPVPDPAATTTDFDGNATAVDLDETVTAVDLGDTAAADLGETVTAVDLDAT